MILAAASIATQETETCNDGREADFWRIAWRHWFSQILEI